MYIEISHRAFIKLVDKKAHENKTTKMSVMARTINYYSAGVHLVAVYNFISEIEQYYIRDINA